MNALDNLIKQAKKIPILTREEEIALGEAYQSGDLSAKQRLVSSNIRLVIKFAHFYKKYCKTRTGIDLEDLVQEGFIGLDKAATKFDPHRGIKFMSYAQRWVKTYMMNYIIKNFSEIKVGTTRGERYLFPKTGMIKQIVSAQDSMRKEKLRKEILKQLPKITMHELLEYEKRVIAFDQVSIEIYDYNINQSFERAELACASNAHENASNNEIRKLVRELLHTTELSSRELDVIRQRYLISEPATLQNIGDQYKVSRERIRQIEQRALKKLRHNAKNLLN